MQENTAQDNINRMGQLIREVAGPVTFRALEIGVAPMEGDPEAFHQLLDAFPGSEVIAFEVDENLCKELNENTRPEIKYFPVALGCKEEERTFYETMHPMCCSIYKPNEALLEKYHNLDVASIKKSSHINTVSLDYFLKQNEISDIDFIKIDVQGAELDVFKGGVCALKNIVTIVSEVEFIPFYIDQPLFGEVCGYLATQGFMFHKFLGVAGRALKPLVMNNNQNYPSQHIWSDAVFVRSILELSQLSAEQLIKMGVLALVYGSPDLAYFCFSEFDNCKKTDLCRRLFNL